METTFENFAAAYNNLDGNLLATTIFPSAPASDPARLQNFHRGTNPHSVQADFRYKLQYNPAVKLSKAEASTWLEIFTAYYNFICKLLPAEEAQTKGALDADWTGVYEEWKVVVNKLYRGYTDSILEAWTIPCLYVAGKYLRIFAIKADVSAASQRENGLAFGSVLQEEDAFGAASKSAQLEDAARQINRIFSLCLTDR